MLNSIFHRLRQKVQTNQLNITIFTPECIKSTRRNYEIEIQKNVLKMQLKALEL